MGIFDWFKKKNVNNQEVSEETTTTNTSSLYTEEIDDWNEVDPKEYVTVALQGVNGETTTTASGCSLYTEETDDWQEMDSKDSISVTLPSIQIDYNEFDSKNIVSTFNYATKVFGEKIIEKPDKLKNILMDLAPSLGKECKLIVLLCQNGKLKLINESTKWEEAELLLWINNATNFLIDEYIDEIVAHKFCRNFIAGVSGQNITDEYFQKIEDERKQAEEREKKKEAYKERAAKAAETRRKNKEEANKREIEELRRKLEAEKLARQEAEKKAEEEKKKAREATSKKKTVENTINYKECITAKALYDKYKDMVDGCFIIVSTDWTGDYCFVVDEFVYNNGLKARGKAYNKGEFSKNYTYPADSTLFHMYNGPSKEKIEQTHIAREKTNSEESVVRVTTSSRKQRVSKNKSNLLVMPGDDEYTSIEKIKAANPGKRIIVIKEGWNNDYCFCVEHFEGTVKAVGKRFLNGEPRGEDWMDRRHRKFKVYNGPSQKKIIDFYK